MTVSKDDLRAAREDLLSKVNARFDALSELVSDPPAPPVPTGKTLNFAAHRYLTTGPIAPNARFYDVQRYRELRRSEFPVESEVYGYLTTAHRPSDRVGWTVPIFPTQVKDSYLAHYPNGNPVTRADNGGDTLLNLVDPTVLETFAQAAAVDAAPLDGIYLDEVDLKMWGYPSSPGYPREFPSEEAWRQAHRNLVVKLADRLHANGKKLWVNLGADYSITDPVQLDIANAADGVNVEFFVGRIGVKMGPAIEADWLRQVQFVRAVENLGRAVHAHASTLAQWVADYAFGSWLMATRFNGSFSASVAYDGSILMPSSANVLSARGLGQPIGEITNGPVPWSYYRRFERGTLEINAGASPANGLAGMSWRIA